MFPLSAISSAMFIQMGMHVGIEMNCPVGMHASEVCFAAATLRNGSWSAARRKGAGHQEIDVRHLETKWSRLSHAYLGRSDHAASPNRSQIGGVPSSRLLL
jgi:hypothetical protein